MNLHCLLNNLEAGVAGVVMYQYVVLCYNNQIKSRINKKPGENVYLCEEPGLPRDGLLSLDSQAGRPDPGPDGKDVEVMH